MALIRRGDIYLINYRPDGREGEATSVHPGIVITNNAANAKAHLLMTVPLTSNVEKLYLTNVLLPNNRTGLDFDSKAQIEAARATHVSRFMRCIGYVPEDLMLLVDEKLRLHLGL